MKLNANARQFRAKMTKQPEIASYPRWICIVMQMSKVICEKGYLQHNISIDTSVLS